MPSAMNGPAGVIIEVAALDVLTSPCTIRDIAEMTRLRGAATVIVGIQPDVALAMVSLGQGTGSIRTALDLEEGIDLLDRSTWPCGRVYAVMEPASGVRAAR